MSSSEAKSAMRPSHRSKSISLLQVNGKVRGRITVPADADQKTVEESALANEQVKGWIAGKTIRKVIVVPNRLVNVVAN
jgi:leucyl-tRNA synthetase